MKLIILSIFTLIFSAQAFSAEDMKTERRPNSKLTVCSFESADVGMIKYRGTSHEAARENVSRACLRARVNIFNKQRGKAPSVDRKILFAEDCVNKTFCR